MTIHVPHQIRPPPNSNPATRGSTRLVPGGTDWFSRKTATLPPTEAAQVVHCFFR
jgi:hypothetical protein